MGNTGSKWRGGQLAFYDKTTHETVQPLAPVVFMDDFLGTAINTDVWTDLDLNSATTTAPAASIFVCAIGAVNENAAAGLYGASATGDKPWNLDKGVIFETRMAVAVAPATTAEITFGLINDSYAADSMGCLVNNECAIYSFFGFYTTVGAGLIPVIRTNDGVNASGIVSSGIAALTPGEYHVYRIDFTDVADVKFYIDGVRVATTTTFNMSNGSNVMCQPWLMVYKKNDAGTNAAGTANWDYVRIWQATR